MTLVRPRILLHRGVIDAQALLFETQVLGEAEARRRLLAHWTHGASVDRLPQGLLLRLPVPERIVCERSDALGLTRQSGALCAAPLGKDELKALDLPQNAVVLVASGSTIVQSLTDATREEPGNWLNFSEWNVTDVHSLGSRPLAPQLLAETAEFDARRQLAGVPPVDPKMLEFLETLKNGPIIEPKKPVFADFVSRLVERLRRRETGPSRPNVFSNALSVTMGILIAPLALAAALLGKVVDLLPRFPESHTVRKTSAQSGAGAGWIGQFFAWLNRLFEMPTPSDTAVPTKTVAAPTPTPPVQRPRVVPRPNPALERLRELVSRMIMMSALGSMIGRQQGQYLADMMQMFERGDFDAALRHAIPLNGMPNLDGGHRPYFLGLLAPRQDLTFNARNTPAASSIGLQQEVTERLKTLYRNAFRRLDEEGRHEEAAFVLAELLHEHEEAVAYLEKHGRLRLAAEMAEARELTPGLVIRQWFVAGDAERAAVIARRTGEFADAVRRLEQSNPEQANALRMLWAATLARSGEYAPAVLVALPVEEARHVVMEWIDRAIELGGDAGAEMLARKAALAPEAFDTLRPQILDLLEDEDPEGIPMRLAFVRTLLQVARTPQTAVIARFAVRSVGRDAGRFHTPALASTLKSLVELSGDGALKADVPTVPTPAAKSLRSAIAPLLVTIAASDVGALDLYDAAFLPNGRMVLALGEAGARLLSRDGRTISHFDQPTHRLVVSDTGDRAIAMAPRGGVQRLAKLDFLSRRTAYWREAEIDVSADSYNGSLWFVGHGQDLLGLDTLGEGFNALWRMPKTGGTIASIGRSTTHCSFLNVKEQSEDEWGRPVESEEHWENWTYVLPSMRLDERRILAPFDPLYSPLFQTVTSLGKLVRLALILHDSDNDPNKYDLVIGERDTFSPSITSFLLSERLGAVVVNDTWAAFAVISASGVRCYLVDFAHLQIRSVITLESASRVGLRLTAEMLTISDNRGRVLVLDLERGALLRNLRVV